ncbi:Uma2 family endonuclease [bacterium]|nr:Uma2 family endonuclease [bacterium]
MGELTRELERFTYEDYLHLPDDGKRYQIIEGEVYMCPSPIPNHQRIIGRLFEIINRFVLKNSLGEVFLAPCDIIFSDENIVQPDIFFISKERSQIVTQKNIQGAPDLAIEILSPHSLKIDKLLKRNLYAKYGVQEYWIVDGEKREVEVLVQRGKAYQIKGKYKKGDTLESGLLKGLRIDLEVIF